MRSLQLLLVVGLGALCLAAQQTAPAPAATSPTAPQDGEQTVEEIIAKVNGTIITREDLVKDRQNQEAGLKTQGGHTESEIQQMLDDAEPNRLRDKIDNQLLIDRADQLEVNVDSDVDQQLSQIMLQYNITEQDQLAKLVQQETGLQLEDFRENLKNKALQDRVVGGEVWSRIYIPHADVVAYYNEHKDDFQREERIYLQQILVSTAKLSDEEALQKAEAIVDRARNGVKFEDLAREHSDADNAKQDGGVLPPYQKGDMRPELEALVWDKDAGYVTDPYKLPNGYLILKVVDHPGAGVAPIEEVENEIISDLRDPLFGPRLREYLNGLRQKAFLEIKDGWVDTGAVPGMDTAWSDPAELTPETVTRQEVIDNPGSKRFLWMLPIPGSARDPTSSSR